MPNQRKKGLKLAAAYIDEETLAAFRLLCESEGVTMADAIRSYVEEALNTQKPLADDNDNPN